MAFLGLSGDTLTFLGGVAEGASKTLDQQISAQQEAIKEASSTMIRARLAGRKKYDSDVEAMTKEIKPLLSQYNLPNVAALMALPTEQRTKIVSQLATIDGKDDRGKFFKAIKEFEGKTTLTESELINSLVPAYKESKMDYSNLIPKTFSDVLFGFDPADKLTTRVKAGVGDIRADVSRTDLTPYEQGLKDEGKIKVFSKDATDATGYTKIVSNSIFELMGGKTTLEDGQYRDVGGQDGDRGLANRFSIGVTNQYTNLVRKLQVSDQLSLEQAEAEAKLRIQKLISSTFKIGDAANNRTKLLDYTNSLLKEGTSPENSYDPLLQGSEKTKTIFQLNLFEQEIAIKDRNNEAITMDVKKEYINQIQKMLDSQPSYSDQQKNAIIDLFIARITKLLSDE